MSGGTALATHRLAKTYRLGLRMRPVAALADLDLSVDEGSIYGFVGPNGAGKSTTIKILVGLIAPTRGDATIFGHAIRDPEARRMVGFLPENPSFHDFLRPLEVLQLMGRLSGMSGSSLRRRSEEVLELVGLAQARDLTVRKFSKGMVQRLGLAQAVMHDPPLLILDEPMSGLDPIGRKDIRDLVFELRRRGKTIFFSTHILPDVESLCDRVGVIVGGKLRDVGRIGELLSPEVRSVELTALAPGAARQPLAAGRLLARDGDRLTVSFADPGAADAAVRALLGSGGQLLSLTPHRETLEDFFVRRLGEAAVPEPRAG